MGKRKKLYVVPVNVDTGERLGVKQLKEWAEELGVEYTTAWNAHKKGSVSSTDKGRYRFEAPTLTELGMIGSDSPGKHPAAPTLANYEAEARWQHVSYGMLQAMRSGAVAKPTRAEMGLDETDDTGKDEQEMTEQEVKEGGKAIEEAWAAASAPEETIMPAPRRVTLGELVRLISGDGTRIDLYYFDKDDNRQWIASVSSNADMLMHLPGLDMLPVGRFRVGGINTLDVYVSPNNLPWIGKETEG